MSRTPGEEQLRNRAVLYEEKQASRRPAQRNTSSTLVPPLDEAQRATYPTLACRREHLRLDLRCSARNHQPAKAFMERVLESGNELVLLTQQIPHCEGLSLFHPEDKQIIRQASRATMYRFLSVYAQRTRALSVVIQKDKQGRIHNHCLVALSDLPQAMQRQLEGAKRGKGGGTMLIGLKELHGVIANTTDLDLERIAKYVSRFGDDRLNLHTFAADRLELLEELAICQQSKAPRNGSQIRLAWTLPRQWKTVLAKDHVAEKRRTGIYANSKSLKSLKKAVLEGHTRVTPPLSDLRTRACQVIRRFKRHFPPGQ